MSGLGNMLPLLPSIGTDLLEVMARRQPSQYVRKAGIPEFTDTFTDEIGSIRSTASMA